MEHKKLIEVAVETVGGQQALADALTKQMKLDDKSRISQQRVWNWLHKTKKVSAEFAVPLEIVTQGKVKAHQLYPESFPVNR